MSSTRTNKRTASEVDAAAAPQQPLLQDDLAATSDVQPPAAKKAMIDEQGTNVVTTSAPSSGPSDGRIKQVPLDSSASAAASEPGLMEQASSTVSAAAAKLGEAGAQIQHHLEGLASGVAAQTKGMLASAEEKLDQPTVAKPPYDMRAVEENAATKAHVEDQQPGLMDQVKSAAVSTQAKVEGLAHTVVDKGSAMLKSNNGGAEDATVTTTTTTTTIQEGGNSSGGITQQVKDGLATAAGAVQAAAAQASAAISGKTGSEVLSEKDQVSDVSHGKERKDGSLPTERNTDEFPQPRKFEQDTSLAPGQSGLGTDKPVGSDLTPKRTSARRAAQKGAGATDSSLDSNKVDDSGADKSNPVDLTASGSSSHVTV